MHLTDNDILQKFGEKMKMDDVIFLKNIGNGQFGDVFLGIREEPETKEIIYDKMYAIK